MPALEAVYGLYHAAYRWPWTLDDLRRSRAPTSARRGVGLAEHFQVASLEHADGLPVLEGVARVHSVLERGPATPVGVR